MLVGGGTIYVTGLSSWWLHGNFAPVSKAWLMRSSFLRCHGRIPSVTSFPFGVVICLSIYHCHINFWKQRRYGNGKGTFSTVQTSEHQRRRPRSSLFRALRNQNRRETALKAVRTESPLKGAVICLMLIYRSPTYRSRRTPTFLSATFKPTARCFCPKGALFLVISGDHRFPSYVVSTLLCLRSALPSFGAEF